MSQVENRWPTASEWVDLFLAHNRDEQEEIAERVIRNTEAASRCFERNHEAFIRQMYDPDQRIERST